MRQTNNIRILIVEDEPHIAQGLKLNLSFQGYELEVAEDGRSALEKWKAWNPDLIILDLMLPVIDGYSILEKIRLEDEKIPILILTAKGELDDKLKGLSCGGDDYMTKPFHLAEFMLRVECLAKRIHQDQIPETPEAYSFGENKINFLTADAVGVRGKFRLTDQELKLLKLFITHQGKPLSRNKLLKVGWGVSDKTTTRTVDNFVVRLRKYFEADPKNPKYFQSLRSIGYMFCNLEGNNQ